MGLDRQELRDEIRFLGDQLGHVIRRIEGVDALQRIESIRFQARNFRHGDHSAREQLAAEISRLKPAELRVVIRAFAVFLNLANLAEDRFRVRVLRQREHTQTQGRGESIRAAVLTMIDQGVAQKEFEQVAAALDIELVLTAHPTEAKRRSVRAILKRIRIQLQRLDQELLPKEREIAGDRIQGELTLLWQTDLVRSTRPTVMQEVERGLSIKPILWKVVPRIIEAFREEFRDAFPLSQLHVKPFLHYGSWIGGDRDGHPDVTFSVTDRAFRWMRAAAVESHLETCERLRAALSITERNLIHGDRLMALVQQRLDQWEPLRAITGKTPVSEVARRWLMTIAWRLNQTHWSASENVSADGQYTHQDELRADVAQLAESLHPEIHGVLLKYELRPWLDRVDVFGLYLARLDVRQDAEVLREVCDELLQCSGICDAPQSLMPSDYVQMLGRHASACMTLDESQISPAACETINLIRWLSEGIWRYGPEPFGGYVISMTRDVADVVRLLWLWRQFARADTSMPIVPLFETISDLSRAASTFDDLLNVIVYRDHLRHWNNRQTIMLGYSDGTKDGGYLSASWALFNAQTTLQEVADRAGIQLTFFHGRGGSLGRGGGPAARSILSLPAKTFRGRLRLTEQGEVLAERYDDPQLAYRHLEQVVWASMLATVAMGEACIDDWKELMGWLAQRSQITYRKLIGDPEFVNFFRRTTPIDAIEKLPIGSRPSRRSSSGGLKGLRAIPWVFSWTQCRWIVPAWYGIGTAIRDLRDERPADADLLVEMYSGWPYFRATIDNAALALAKADMPIATLYGELAQPTQAHIVERIRVEFELARESVRFVTGQAELLESVAWLRDSIHVRNFYTDPLNLIQIELLRRLDAGEEGGNPEDIDSLMHLMRLTINGIASGMRTTG